MRDSELANRIEHEAMMRASDELMAALGGISRKINPESIYDFIVMPTMTRVIGVYTARSDYWTHNFYTRMFPDVTMAELRYTRHLFIMNRTPFARFWTQMIKLAVMCSWAFREKMLYHSGDYNIRGYSHAHYHLFKMFHETVSKILETSWTMDYYYGYRFAKLRPGAY